MTAPTLEGVICVSLEHRPVYREGSLDAHFMSA